ncbi:MAG: hypothetical protein M3N16_00490 [Actinomycetota bacterium]|nr:hypothetical protein [Actinomycetota bacterium]
MVLLGAPTGRSHGPARHRGGHAGVRRRYAGHWTALALLFVVLSADETAKLHELSTGPLRDALDIGGALHYAWVVPGIALAAGCAAVYGRFVLGLPRPIRRLVVGAAAVYLTAALGLELVEGLLGRWETDESLGLGLVGTFQETGEMLGILVFLRAMVLHLESLSPEIALRLAGRPRRNRP